MKNFYTLFVAVISVLAIAANANASIVDFKSDTTKGASKKPNMGYKYNKQHHLKADGTPSKLYHPQVVKDTGKRKA